ncbi:hypothetical protein GCM10009555_008560 [Acrocarpospora macrocephala]|uniref:TauD/TfdA-like domain-containing protein n=1 Tax=Acrocarpospora macrocephala TaxID=150177 RepID=A0A5M3X5C4_9ACTN|nr:hypothetical protein [Acrocarpospora macrocephala]GES14861.1 hypothetical protein Amac_084580 [Acrocarpospora macrocephala]
MRFPLMEQLIDCSLMKHEEFWPETAPVVAENAVAGLERYGFVVFKIGMLRLDGDASRRLAHRVAAELRTELIRAGAPDDLGLEIDAAQATPVPEPFSCRSLLPHHDGQHASYLTPSVLDEPDWDPAWRTFSSSGYTTTHAHKMYQGIFIADPGEALSVTTYYDWLRILEDVKSARFIGNPDVPSTARWLGDNLRRALDAGLTHSFSYPTVGGMLGLTETALLAVPLLHCERTVAAEMKERFPLLHTLSGTCPCRGCAGEVTRVFCNVTSLAMGLTWPEFRARYEVQVPGERFDLLVGHNLTTLHGGLAGGRGRVIEPLCLVVDKPSGSRYEAWLSRSWRRLSG